MSFAPLTSILLTTIVICTGNARSLVRKMPGSDFNPMNMDKGILKRFIGKKIWIWFGDSLDSDDGDGMPSDALLGVVPRSIHGRWLLATNRKGSAMVINIDSIKYLTEGEPDHIFEKEEVRLSVQEIEQKDERE